MVRVACSVTVYKTKTKYVPSHPTTIYKTKTETEYETVTKRAHPATVTSVVTAAPVTYTKPCKPWGGHQPEPVTVTATVTQAAGPHGGGYKPDPVTVTATATVTAHSSWPPKDVPAHA